MAAAARHGPQPWRCERWRRWPSWLRCLVLAVWWGVSRSLAPVERVRRQLAQRQADDLSPVSDAQLPDEVQPLVSELNLLFERVQRAFDAQEHFVADAAHELRSPLAALRLQLQGLQRAGDDAARAAAVERLASGIDRATRLVGAAADPWHARRPVRRPPARTLSR